MRRKAVAQSVRANLGVEARATHVFLHQYPEHLPSKGATGPANKDPRGVRRRLRQSWPRLLEVGGQRLYGTASQRHHALLASLADAFAEARLKVEIVQPQSDDFRGATAGSVQGLENRLVA